MIAIAYVIVKLISEQSFFLLFNLNFLILKIFTLPTDKKLICRTTKAKPRTAIHSH